MKAPSLSANSTQCWLRERTRDYHLAAERAMNLPYRLGSLPAYVDLLQRLWRIYSAFENSLARFDWQQVDIDFAKRQRAHWIAQDIVAMGGIPNNVRPLSLPIHTLDEALGALYVIEGSTLGAQIILRKAIDLPGVTPQAGARFFHGHAEHTMAMWKVFIDSLDRYGERAPSMTLLEKGALHAFAEFIVALQG